MLCYVESFILCFSTLVQGEGKMRSIMTANNSSQKTPQVFTDEELSEIFQINFAEIFGQPSFSNEPKNIQPKKNDNNKG